jgi:hypothetical protein
LKVAQLRIDTFVTGAPPGEFAAHGSIGLNQSLASALLVKTLKPNIGIVIGFVTLMISTNEHFTLGIAWILRRHRLSAADADMRDP